MSGLRLYQWLGNCHGLGLLGVLCRIAIGLKRLLDWVPDQMEQAGSEGNP